MLLGIPSVPNLRMEKLMDVLFQEYLSRVLTYRELHHSIRLGQAHFNVLDEVRPDLADQVRATPLDPFYMDEMVPVFLDWAKANW